jgi:hypothetical protein
MSTLVPAIILHLDPTQDPDVRLAFLALLETMLGSDAIAQVRLELRLSFMRCGIDEHLPWASQSFKPFNTELLLKAIVPSIVWQGGRVAATIRYVWFPLATLEPPHTDGLFLCCKPKESSDRVRLHTLTPRHCRPAVPL